MGCSIVNIFELFSQEKHSDISQLISSLNLFINLGTIINLILFILIGTVITIYGTINDRHPKFDEKNIYCSKLPNGETINIIHLTDLHLGACYDEKYVKFLIDKILSILTIF